jgi:hypothetical protein
MSIKPSTFEAAKLFDPSLPFLYILLASLFLIIIFILAISLPPKSKIIRFLEKLVYGLSFPALLLNLLFLGAIIWDFISKKIELTKAIENCDPSAPLGCIGPSQPMPFSSFVLAATPFIIFTIVSLVFIIGQTRLFKKRQQQTTPDQTFPKQSNSL